MIKANSIRNSTSLDEAGFKFGIVRQKDEKINSYRERVYNAMRNSMDSEKYAFEKNLGICTTLKSYNIFEIDLVDESLKLNIEIKDNRLIFYLNDEIFHNEKLSELKFLFKVKEIFELYPNYFTIKELSDVDYAFFKAVNLMPKTSKRNYLSFEANTFVHTLPEKHVEYVQDYNGLFITNSGLSENVNTFNTYSLVGNVLHKFDDTLDFINFEYREFPFTIKWLPIKATSFNSENIEDTLYDLKKDNENYGAISNGNLVESSEKNKVLSQKGARIVDLLLEKQNTYWGE